MLAAQKQQGFPEKTRYISNFVKSLESYIPLEHSPTDQYYLDPLKLNIQDFQNNALGTFDQGVPVEFGACLTGYYNVSIGRSESIQTFDILIGASTTVVAHEIFLSSNILKGELYKDRTQQIIELIPNNCKEFLEKNEAVSEFVKYVMVAEDVFETENIIDIEIIYEEDPDVKGHSWVNVEFSLREDINKVIEKYNNFIDAVIDKINPDKTGLFSFTFRIK